MDQERPAALPVEHETKAQAPQATFAGTERRGRLVAHRASLVGLHRHEAITASRAMRQRGADEFSRTKKPTDDRLAFDKGHSKMLLAKGQYLSSPSQGLDLRPDSIWLSEGENHLWTWPPGVEVACICGHEMAPAGHQADDFSGLTDAFFGLADMAMSGVALMSARPCLKRTPKQRARGPN